MSELNKPLPKSRLQIISEKILSPESLRRKLALWKLMNEKVVFTNGCFDILHLGHIDYLSKSSDLGTKLLVGINTDSSVKRLAKGKSRPIQDEQSRAMIMASLHVVDAVILFDEDTPYDLIKTVQPDVLVKGSDYKPEEIVGYDIVKNKGGKIVTIDFLPGFSTTSIEQRIKNV